MTLFTVIKVASLVLCGLPAASAAGIPHVLQKRALNIHVLKAHPGSTETEACQPGDVKKIEEMVASTIYMADAAVKALSVANVAKSSAFVSLFGTKVSPADISAQHYAPIVHILKVPTGITDLKSVGEHDLVFTCPVEAHEPKAARPKGPADRPIYASTRNWDGKGKLNLVRIMPYALDGDSTIDAVAKQFQATKSFKEPVPLPFMLVHEAQHSVPIVGAHRVGDQVVGGVKMYGLNQQVVLFIIHNETSSCIRIRNILHEDLKVKNAQNFAWFAMLAVSRPDLLTDACSGGKPAPIPRDLRLGGFESTQAMKRWAMVCPQRSFSSEFTANFNDDVEN